MMLRKNPQKSIQSPGIVFPRTFRAFISSNTVMAVVPDSNRISFYIYSVNNFSNRIFSYHYYFYVNSITYFFRFCNNENPTNNQELQRNYRHIFHCTQCSFHNMFCRMRPRRSDGAAGKPVRSFPAAHKKVISRALRRQECADRPSEGEALPPRRAC